MTPSRAAADFRVRSRAVAVRARRRARAAAARFTRQTGPEWLCPLCNRRGQFLTKHAGSGPRRYAECSRCGALERHRLQAWAVRSAGLVGPGDLVLQFAPDPLTKWLQGRCRTLFSADLSDPRGDTRLDLRSLGIRSDSVDVVYASHVLEHVDDDAAAISEIARVLRPGGRAILPVPLVAPSTIEYGEPSPAEEMHVRAAGPDYLDRYRQTFRAVDLIRSGDAPAEIQPFVYEDRSVFPTAAAPRRPPMPGIRHADIVPVCFR